MYIAKTSSINDELDALRHRATKSLFERQDVVVVASVSCIYGLGLPTNYLEARMLVETGQVRHIAFPFPVTEQILLIAISRGLMLNACSLLLLSAPDSPCITKAQF